jgi:hypothetical protein
MITTVEVHKQNESIVTPNVTPNEVYPSAPSAVSWGAILAGAAGAAALSLILLILGSGLGFSVISPWANEGVSAKTFGISGILWLTLTSIAASGMGGYLAGRLRTRWTSVDRAEVYFRDTAHGFLAWGVATLLTAGVFTSTIALVVGGGVKAGAEAAKGVGASAATLASAAPSQFNLDGDSTGYFIDLLFRPSNATSPSTSTSTTNEDLNAASSTAAISSSETLEDGTIIEQHPTQPSTSDTGITSPVTFGEVPTAEVARIFINALRAGSLPEGDAHYLGQIVSEHTSLPQPEAKDRVKAIYNQWQSKLQEVEKTVKEAADEARKTTAYISLWFFIALLIGAFTASWLATYGGAQRDL